MKVSHNQCPPKNDILFLGVPGGDLVLASGAFDEDGGQSAENKCLDAAAEPVKVQARKGRDTDLEQLQLAQHAGSQPKMTWLRLASAQYSRVEMTVPDKMLPK